MSVTLTAISHSQGWQDFPATIPQIHSHGHTYCTVGLDTAPPTQTQERKAHTLNLHMLPFRDGLKIPNRGWHCGTAGKATTCDDSTPCAHRFDSQLSYFYSSSLLMQLAKQQQMAQVLGL